MSLKLSIASSRKIGEPNYSSRGATVGLEIEVESGLADSPQQLRAQLARLFQMARDAVDQELDFSVNSRVTADESGSGNAPPRRPATARQIRAIWAIANRWNLDLGQELQSRFNLVQPVELSREEASQFITAFREMSRAEALT